MGEFYNDEYADVVLRGTSYDMVARAEVAICGGDTSLLEDLLEELRQAISELEKLKALVSSDVDYYNLQSSAVGTTGLKKQYLLNKVKLSLIIGKLNYLRNIEGSISAVLNKNIEMQLK